MDSVVRVVIVDDDALVRAGLSLMLDGAQGIRVVGEAGDGAALPQILDAHAVDVVLMDLRMPRVDGILATQRTRARRNPPHVIVLTTFDTDEHVVRALHAGASGFLLKDTPPERIVEAIRKIVAGEPILSPAVMRRLMERAVTGANEKERARAAIAKLSPREREVALCVAKGQSNADIARELEMTIATVKAHLSHIFVKLGVENRTQIALLTHEARLL